jgi:hypothetical protein
MRRMLAYHGLRVTVDGESAEFEDDLARLGTMITDGVLRLLSLAEIGPDTDPPFPPDIRFGIDRRAGRGMLQWVPTGEYAVDPSVPSGGRLLLDGRDLGRGIVAYAPWQTRLDPATVRAGVLDYVRTGCRPRGFGWVSRTPSHTV